MFARSFRTSKTFTTLVVSFAIFTDILIQNLVVPVLPYALHTRAGLKDEDDIQRWTSILLAAFGATLMSGCLVFGYMADLFRSRRTPFLLGLVLLSLSTLFFALATSVWALLAARTLQGLSTAVVHTIGYTLLTEVVGKQHLGRAMGYTSMALSSGLLLGPVLGGVLYEYCGYFQVFLPAFGLIAIEVILRCLVIEKEKRQANGAIAPLAHPVATTQTTSQTLTGGKPSLSTESEPLLSHPPASRAHGPGAYRALLTTPRFVVALTSLCILNSIANGFDSTLVPFVQNAFNMQSSRAAVLFLALATPMLLAPFSGWLADRFGPRPPVLVGMIVAILSFGFLSLISPATGMPLLKMVIMLAFVGLAFALAMGPLGVDAILAVHDIEEHSAAEEFGAKGILAQAIGLQNTIIAAGGLLGPLYAGFVKVALGWKGLEGMNAGLCAFIFILAILSVIGKEVDEMQTVATAV